MGCAPYLVSYTSFGALGTKYGGLCSNFVHSKQIFKAGKLIYTTAATVKPDQQLEDLPFVKASDGAIPFNDINLTLSGDILVRARHLTSDNKRVSMFRWVFVVRSTLT